MNELLGEIEALLYSGTKINIDYFLDEIIDEDRINDILIVSAPLKPIKYLLL